MAECIGHGFRLSTTCKIGIRIGEVSERCRLRDISPRAGGREDAAFAIVRRGDGMCGWCAIGEAVTRYLRRQAVSSEGEECACDRIGCTDRRFGNRSRQVVAWVVDRIVLDLSAFGLRRTARIDAELQGLRWTRICRLHKRRLSVGT